MVFRSRSVCQYPITPLPPLLVPTPKALALASITQRISRCVDTGFQRGRKRCATGFLRQPLLLLRQNRNLDAR